MMEDQKHPWTKDVRLANDAVFISILIPVRNEEENIIAAYEHVKTYLERILPQQKWEMIFTDNHSSDQSFQILKGLALIDDRVKVVRFDQDFGYQRSLMTACHLAFGQVALLLDCDLQDPIELLTEFLKEWRLGAKVVYGERIDRQESWYLKSLRRIAYRFLNRLDPQGLALDAGDFRLLDQRVLAQLRILHKVKASSRPFLRGMIHRMDFSQIGVPYHRKARTQGESKFPIWELIKLAVDAIFESPSAIIKSKRLLLLFVIGCVGISVMNSNWLWLQLVPLAVIITGSLLKKNRQKIDDAINLGHKEYILVKNTLNLSKRQIQILSALVRGNSPNSKTLFAKQNQTDDLSFFAGSAEASVIESKEVS